MNEARRRRGLQALLDVGSWFVGFTIALVLRAEFDLSAVPWGAVVVASLLAGALQLGYGLLAHIYRGRYSYGSFEEVAAVGLVGVGVALTIELIALQTTPRVMPASRPLVAGIIAISLMLFIRYGVRFTRDQRNRPSDEAEKVIMLGAGDAGRQLVKSIQTNPRSPYQVVAILDDDPAKMNLRVVGIRVYGTRADLARVMEETGATTVVAALPQANAASLREINNHAIELGLKVKVVPALVDLPDGTVGVFDIRDISEEDLLGRSAVRTDLTEIGQFLHGKRVLITGAGGSIGSELARQVHAFEPAALGLLDRDENGLHSTQLSIQHRALLDDENTILASIRDEHRMREAFEAFRPDIVFHAAALKHLPLLEKFPAEAAKTNVFGTLNVLRAAQHVGVQVFVNISTDKAANPISVLGYSKRITERLTAAVGSESEGTYVSVRFGNVLGSQGSVLHSFADQIAQGGPITVTHPDVSRYFMTIPEAVQLVLQAAAIGDDGRVCVLDMGEPVRIADVARHLIAQSGQGMGLLFTGLRPGEKLSEDLLGDGEIDLRPHHELVSEVPVAPLWPSMLGRLDLQSDCGEMRVELSGLAATRVPVPDEADELILR